MAAFMFVDDMDIICMEPKMKPPDHMESEKLKVRLASWQEALEVTGGDLKAEMFLVPNVVQVGWWAANISYI